MTQSLSRLAAVIAAFALSAGVAACGSDSSSSDASAASGSGTAALGASDRFAAEVAKYKKPISTWPGPNSSTTPPKGKKIVVITCSSQGNGCVRAAGGVTKAGAKFGWDVTTIDGKGDPAAWNAGILSAIADHADGIVLDAVPPPLVGAAVAKAHAAGIAVVEIFQKADKPVFAYVNPDHTAQGVAMADWVAADSKGRAHVLIVEDNEFKELMERVDGFKSELAKCSGCKIVGTVSSQIGTMAQELPQAIVSALTAHPDANYVVSQYDSNATFAGQGVRSAGKQGQVKVVGYEGDAQSVDAIRKGDIQAATVADPAEWMGWQAVDELSRAFNKRKPENTPVPWRLLDKSNVPSSGGWAGDFDFESKFAQIWGA
jgi:ribose transport system substrate-binding protein